MNCLVVDDSRVMRRAARRLMESFGFAVREAADGAAALAACQESLPDLVLLDWSMPVMDGLAFLRAARGRYGAERPVVMFCTGINTRDHILEALDAGAQEYLMKPYDAGILGGKLVQLGLLGQAA